MIKTNIKKLLIIAFLAILVIGIVLVLVIKQIKIGKQNQNMENESTETAETSTLPESSLQEISENWELKWNASKPITINGKKYIVKGIAFDVNYRFSNTKEHHLVVQKNYSKENLYGEEVYHFFAELTDNGITCKYSIYVDPRYFEEYTGGMFWVPSVYDMISGLGIKKLSVGGPHCTHFWDEKGNMGGNHHCCSIDMGESFDEYNTIWSFPTGFYGGIYNDAFDLSTLTSDGEGYTVRPGDTVTIAGMNFETYKVAWEGDVGGKAWGKGETIVAPKLPFPVEITALLKLSPEKEAHFHVKLTDLKLELIN